MSKSKIFSYLRTVCIVQICCKVLNTVEKFLMQENYQLLQRLMQLISKQTGLSSNMYDLSTRPSTLGSWGLLNSL